MRRFSLLGIILVMILLMPALVSAQGDSVQIVIGLSELNESGITGTAKLKASGDQTEVTITLRGGPRNPPPRPNHVHFGTCDNLGGVAYALTDVTREAKTVLDVPLSALRDGNYAINVHKSAEEIGVYVACGNIPAMVMMESEPEPEAKPEVIALPKTGGVPPIWLGLMIAGFLTLLAGLMTRRTASRLVPIEKMASSRASRDDTT